MDKDKEWRIEHVTSEEFAKVTNEKIISIYNTAAYNSANNRNTHKIWYLIVFKGNTPRFSAVLGEKNNTVYMPFSAPFGYPEVLKQDTNFEDYFVAYELAYNLLKGNGITAAEIYMAPDFYDINIITAWNSVFLQKGFEVQCYDQNYTFFDIDELIFNYESKIHRNAKKNLRIAREAGSVFKKCQNDDEWAIAYNVIKQNRIARQHPLRMSLDQVMSVRTVVNSEMFLVKNEGEYIAAALVYPVTKDIAQVIYWGDKPGYENLKPTNFISFELLKYYADKGFRHLDVGISTVEGVPNFGLCDFKESIGCTRNGKMRLVKKAK